MDSGCCGCPFCSPSSVPLLCSPKFQNPRLSWRLCFIFLLLLLGGCEASRLKRFASEGEEVASVQYVEKFDPQGSDVPDCAIAGSCSCTPIGKCKPCSRLDISQKLPECMVSGYRQRSICLETVDQEKYTSCHYVANPAEVKRFWLFEGSVFSVGLLAYAVVVYRIKTLDRLTAHRIQQQINA